ncbi:MAG: type I secretion system permease/ATPase [Pseudomonadota bacterium]
MVTKKDNTAKRVRLFDVPGFGSSIITVGLFSLVVNLLVLAMPVYTLQLFDRVLGSRSIDTLVLLTIAVGIALVMQVAIDAVRARILQRLAARFESYHSESVLQATLIQSARKGEATAQPMRDLTEVKNAIGSPVATTILDAPWAPFFLIATFILHPVIGYLTLSGMVILFILALFHAWYVNRTHGALNDDAIRAFENMQDYADHADALVSMGMRDAVCAGWRQKAHQMLIQQIAMNQNSSAVQSVSKMIRMSLQVAVMGIGCYLVLQLQMSAGAMIAASIIMARALAPAEQSISSWKTLSSAREALDRLKTVIAADTNRRPQIPVSSIDGHLELDRVSYALPGMNRPILQTLSVQIEPGNVVGIIGPSGSGKSTLARLMVGVLEPTSGYVRLDSVDVTRRSAFDLGSHIGYLPQEVQLFQSTITNNIARLGEADPEAVRHAAQLAGVEQLINRLPDDYETVIGRSGVRLSGGQQQRIGLARALFGLPKLLVLDEPDASLDPDGIDQLIRAIENMKTLGSTIILISHRPQLLSITDRLILLRDGRIHADGDQASVLETIGVSMAERPKSLPPTQGTEGSAQAESNDVSAPASDTDPNAQPLTPMPIANWPEAIKAKWREAYHAGRLPSDAQSRRNSAIIFGFWLAYLRRFQIDLDSPLELAQVKQLTGMLDHLDLPYDRPEKVEILVRVLRGLNFLPSALSIEQLHDSQIVEREETA